MENSHITLATAVHDCVQVHNNCLPLHAKNGEAVNSLIKQLPVIIVITVTFSINYNFVTFCFYVKPSLS